MIETVTFQGKEYPKFQTTGNAASYITPFARQVCQGTGFDIGCGKLEWVLSGAIPIDPAISPAYNSNNLPFDLYEPLDYIFSSHCLEHVDNWFETLKYWYSGLKTGGTMFLYLPDYSQEYWRPWNNPKHKHIFTPAVIQDAFHALGLKKVFVSGVDLYNSFAVMGEK